MKKTFCDCCKRDITKKDDSVLTPCHSICAYDSFGKIFEWELCTNCFEKIKDIILNLQSVKSEENND